MFKKTPPEPSIVVAPPSEFVRFPERVYVSLRPELYAHPADRKKDRVAFETTNEAVRGTEEEIGIYQLVRIAKFRKIVPPPYTEEVQ